MAYSANLQFKTISSNSKTAGVGTNTGNITENIQVTIAEGTGAGQGDASYSFTETLAPAGSTDFDLDDSTSVGNIFGDDTAYAKINSLMIQNTGDTNALTVSGDFLGLSTDSETVEPGGIYFRYFGTAARTVVATTADVVTVASTGGTTYKLTLTGIKV